MSCTVTAYLSAELLVRRAVAYNKGNRDILVVGIADTHDGAILYMFGFGYDTCYVIRI